MCARRAGPLEWRPPCNDLVVELVSEAETDEDSAEVFDANLERMTACLERNAL